MRDITYSFMITYVVKMSRFRTKKNASECASSHVKLRLFSGVNIPYHSLTNNQLLAFTVSAGSARSFGGLQAPPPPPIDLRSHVEHGLKPTASAARFLR